MKSYFVTILIIVFQLQLLIQEILLRVTEANPGRTTGWEEVEQLPNRSWVRRFAERHNLVLRFGMV